MSKKQVPIADLNAPFVCQYYSQNASAVVCSSLDAFKPYRSNFVNAMGVIDTTCPDGALSLDFPLNVSPKTPSMANSRLIVRLTFPPAYPQQILCARLLPPVGTNFQIRQPSAVMDANGRIQLECLSFLRGVERPYAILDVLLAVTEQFELEYPLVSAQEQRKPVSDPRDDMRNVLSAGGTNPERASLIQECAEKVVIDLNEKASKYLDTREQSLSYLHRLNESNRELTKAKAILEKHKADIKSYIPKVGNGAQLLSQMESSLKDTPEDHVACIVASSPLQEQAFELMAASRANIETLAVLEDALRNECLNSDDYIKAVAEVGRKDFITTFLYRQVFNELAKADTAAAQAPSVPPRLSPEEALLREFPNAGSDLIRDVLASVGNDAGRARQQLRSMFSA